MTGAGEALLILLLTVGPAVEASFRAPTEKVDAAAAARKLLRDQGCEQPTVEMRDPERGRERLRAWCRDGRPPKETP